MDLCMHMHVKALISCRKSHCGGWLVSTTSIIQRRTRPGPGRNLGQSKTTLNHENTTNP
jgi:hypothetical protein